MLFLTLPSICAKMPGSPCGGVGPPLVGSCARVNREWWEAREEKKAITFLLIPKTTYLDRIVEELTVDVSIFKGKFCTTVG